MAGALPPRRRADSLRLGPHRRDRGQRGLAHRGSRPARPWRERLGPQRRLLLHVVLCRHPGCRGQAWEAARPGRRLSRRHVGHVGRGDERPHRLLGTGPRRHHPEGQSRRNRTHPQLHAVRPRWIRDPRRGGGGNRRLHAQSGEAGQPGRFEEGPPRARRSLVLALGSRRSSAGAGQRSCRTV